MDRNSAKKQEEDKVVEEFKKSLKDFKEDNFKEY